MTCPNCERLKEAIEFAIGEFQREDGDLSVYCARQIYLRLSKALTQPTPQPTEENCFLGGAELSPMKYVRIQAMTASGSPDCPTKEETCATPGGIGIGSAPCPDCPPCGLCGDTGFSARLAGKHYESIPCPNGCKPKEQEDVP